MTAERLITRSYGCLELKQSYQQGLLLGLLAAALLHFGALWGLSMYGELGSEPSVVGREPHTLDDGRLRMERDIRLPEEAPPPAEKRLAGRTEAHTGGEKIVIVDDNTVIDDKFIPTNDERAKRLNEWADSSVYGSGDSLMVGTDPDWVSPLPEIDDFTAVDREPQPLPNQHPAPEYPEMARLMEVEGKVVLRILIGESGDVLKVVPLTKEGTISPLLVDAAMRVVWEWKFIPALQNGRHVPVWFNQVFKFKLR